MKQDTVVILTCEHGGNDLPAKYEKYFRGAKEVLKTHRGWDPGGLECAIKLKQKLSTQLFYSTTTRLLVDLNRSLDNPSLFSEWSRVIPEELRKEILADYYQPYRKIVEAEIKKLTSRKKRVIHISMHSFTPVLKGKTRKADIGILFDPRRKSEVVFASRLKSLLQKVFPDFAIYKNSPYRGTSDGFTTCLRTKYSGESYTGIEIEINQKFPQGNKKAWQKFMEQLCDAFMNCTVSY